MEEQGLKIDPYTGEVMEQPTVEEIKEEMNKMEELFKDDKSPLQDLNNLSILDDDLFDDSKKPQPYTTDLIENIQKIEPSLTVDQISSLVEYAKGGIRPEFMDTMLTQTNDKLIESMKLMTVLQLLRLPGLYDYLNALQKNMLDKDSIAKMSFEDISKVSANVQKEINDILNFSLSVATKLSNTNTVPTKVEKLANALMGVSDSTRQRIEEIIAMEQ